MEDYRYVQFDYEANDKWNKDGAGYGVDGTYEICLETIRNDTGLIREDIREEAQKVITDYKNDLRSGNVEGADHNGYIYYAKIYHSGIMDRIKAKYRVAASVDINGTEYAAVLIYDCYYFAKQVYRKVIKIFLLVALIGSAVTFVLALLIYQRRKTNYQLYRYRSNLTDNMAQALKAPLEEIAESVDSLSRDNTKDEQYTAEISRKIESMNGLITDLLKQAKNDTVS